jgi:hypothetical protein
MLSNTSRFLTYACAVLYAILGLIMYLMPAQIAPVFAWKVTEFMTITIGGWCLGNAWLAYLAARRWEWKLIYTALLYLWVFGISELIVLYLFRDKLILGHPIAWLYFITLIVNTITAIIGVIDYIRIRPSNELSGPSMSKKHYAMVIAFVIFVGFLGVYGMTAQIGDFGTNGGIFPEVMSLFTLRSFGVFYFALALGVVPFLWNKRRNVRIDHLYYGCCIHVYSLI